MEIFIIIGWDEFYPSSDNTIAVYSNYLAAQLDLDLILEGVAHHPPSLPKFNNYEIVSYTVND